MGKLQNNQTGFGAVEAILILIIVGILGFTGWYVWQAKNNTDKSLASSNSTTPDIKKKNTTKAATPNPVSGYLTLKEWGVKIATPDPISNATYNIVTNNKNLHPSAFLSTAALDASADCKAYYSRGTSDGNPLPTFQYIERFALTDTTSLDEGQTTITAQQASKQQSTSYKQIGNYVYYYRHGNGMPCQEETSAQENAFETAFATINQTQ